jgi:hypothetical protein
MGFPLMQAEKSLVSLVFQLVKDALQSRVNLV